MLKTIKLKGEQKDALFLPVKNPIQIKGVAGSGKTTVALYRAKYLLDTQSNLFNEAKVAIFTYNKALSAYITQISHHIEGGYQQDLKELNPKTEPGINVAITNFHSWVYNFLKENGISLQGKIIKNYQIDLVIKTVKSRFNDYSIAGKAIEFFKDEIVWIKGKLFQSEQEYVDAKRVGRGTTDRVVKKDKKLIWKIYQEYQEELKKSGKCDWEDFAILSLEIIENNPSFEPPFSHLIIDEAQDLSKAQILFLSKLVSQETNSITIIADVAQRIYKSGFSWSEVGINIKGRRTIEFKKNYRNTVHIAKAALSLLEKETDNSEFTQVEITLRGEKKPVIGYFEDYESQIAYIKKELNSLISDNKINSTVILHRNHLGLDEIEQRLKSDGFHITRIKNNQAINYNSDAIKICTLSSIKGLEFTNVFIVDLNDDIIPYPSGFYNENDELHVSTERRLLYTAMTRARLNLYMLSSGNPSRYLCEIDKKLVDVCSKKINIKLNDTDEIIF